MVRNDRNDLEVRSPRSASDWIHTVETELWWKQLILLNICVQLSRWQK